MLSISIGSGFFEFWGEDLRSNRHDSVYGELEPLLITEVVGLARVRLVLPSGSGHRLGWTSTTLSKGIKIGRWGNDEEVEN